MAAMPADSGAFPRWQSSLQAALRSTRELLQFCQLNDDELDVDADPEFPLRLTREWAARIRKGDARDPLLLQVLPRRIEQETVEGFVSDPTGDLQALAAPGLLHKYHGRCLLVATQACAVHCRYCFRRHFPYADQSLSLQTLENHLSRDASVREVILSGGDPLMLSTHRLHALGEVLQRHAQVSTLRIHTRMPVVLPARVDEDLLQWLNTLRQRVVMVLHVNHARELDAETALVLQQLRNAGVCLLNQAVLLRDVNDDTDSLRALCETLFTQGVLPYYLHLLDPVAGAAHFQVDEGRALHLHSQLRASLPGYLVPRLAREIAGEAAKRVLAG